jgi:exosortase N
MIVAGVRQHQPAATNTQPLPAIAGYTASRFDKDVVRYAGNNQLVYIKRTAGILGAEHNPAMCWLGAGYAMSLVQETNTPHGTMYTATLVKGNEQLYTAWWYDNGTDHTTSQLAWRWQVLKGAHPFSIINVTTATQAELEAATQTILREGTFRAAL